MRKIETQMNRAIREHRDWSSGNTSVVAHGGPNNGHCNIYLHNNLIAVVQADRVKFTLAGWPTPTTRSRLNALFQEFACPGTRIYQHDHEQYVTAGVKSMPDVSIGSRDWGAVPRWSSDCLGFGPGRSNIKVEEHA